MFIRGSIRKMAIDLVKFGNEVRNIRELAGFSQTRVHNETGISVSTIRKIENGHHEPRLSTLELLTTLYKVDLVYLIHRFRTHTDFFSDWIIAETNEKLHIGDITGLVDVLVRIGEDNQEYFSGTKYKGKDIKLFKFFEQLKAIQIDETRSTEKTIPILEELLFNLNWETNRLLSDTFHFYIETQISIILGLSYSTQGKYQEALRHFKSIIHSFDLLNYHSYREQDFYTTAHIGIIWIDLHLLEYRKIVDRIDMLLRKDKMHYLKDTRSELYMLKAIALFKLDDKRYYSVAENLLLYAETNLIKKRYIPNFRVNGLPIDRLIENIDLG